MRIACCLLVVAALSILPGVEGPAAEERPFTLMAQRLEEDRPTPTTPRVTPEREHFQLKLTPGYEQGDYGAHGTTEIFAIPLTLRYLGDTWDLSATFSYLHVES